jgi:ribokinase
MPRILVVGSINIDLVARLDRLPQRGETVVGRELRYVSGGKGANQAVAASRLGAAVTMIGRVGDDPFGDVLLANLHKENVATDHIAVVPNCSSGLAWIGVDDAGENAITVVAGANGRLTPADIRAAESVIADAEALLLQLEIPLESAAEAARLARRHGVPTILDAAPAPSEPLPLELVVVDVLTPNQSEAEALVGFPVLTPNDAHSAARKLQARGARRVVIKLGELGAAWLDESGAFGHAPARRIEPVDTTAAGDAFTAALAVALAEGKPLSEAVRRGCAAGTLAVMKPGAQSAMPSRAEVERHL